ncbi:MAG TPA: hypothetical protein VN937_15220 [Blastocatellia bacterium]|nr:hypothetical protein [Blastocatellia bacterium]
MIGEAKDNQLILRWETPNSLPFPMPVEVKVGEETKRIEMTNGTATIPLPANKQYAIDPNDWILKAQK